MRKVKYVTTSTDNDMISTNMWLNSTDTNTESKVSKFTSIFLTW